ncbi:CoA-binding protein [Methylobacterium sp. WL6]|uniref:CoA-binding protein n=1 Tax=Methylobacterium sp. WL6 TaxID=2603901 RepID=UPI0011CCB525|nr:CoA-binding protein [Methylobacterium sp. WL6]TXN58086.1 hypothetical protein FV230_27655 [Methylobacterium sp. WL6]
MSTYRFEALLTPRSVAVVGAGARAGSLGRAVFDKIRAGGFPGPVHPVHPQDAEADGVACVARIADLPAVPDLAVVASPPESIPGIVAEAGRAGVRAAILLTAGLGTEPDDPGPRAARIAREHGLRLLGPALSRRHLSEPTRHAQRA